MKKIIALFLSVACIVGLLTACSSKNSNEAIAFSLDAKGNYTGFSKLPKNYTAEDAEKDGYYVRQDSKVIANNKTWDSFIETAAKGSNAGIRMVSFYTEDNNSPHFNDLFFNDGHYYLFDSSSDNQEKQPFSYLLTLKGQYGNPLKDSGVVVLSNDNSLTYYDIMKTITSSNYEYIKSVSPYKLVMFQ